MRTPCFAAALAVVSLVIAFAGCEFSGANPTAPYRETQREFLASLEVRYRDAESFGRKWIGVSSSSEISSTDEYDATEKTGELEKVTDTEYHHDFISDGYYEFQLFYSSDYKRRYFTSENETLSVGDTITLDRTYDNSYMRNAIRFFNLERGAAYRLTVTISETDGLLRASLARSGESVDEKWALNGSGSEYDPYVITTAEQLAEFSRRVSEGKSYEGEYIRLDADIDLEGGTQFSSFSTSDVRQTWLPIGDANHGFAGTFDGQGHKIDGLYIKAYTKQYAGLFGKVSGSVKNVVLGKGYIDDYSSSTDSYIGAVVGYLDNSGAVVSCGNEGTECHSSQYVGGLVGYGYGSVSIKNCYNKGSFYSSSSSCKGGIAGYLASSSASIENCYYSGPANLDGSIVGYCSSGQSLRYCYYYGSGKACGNRADPSTCGCFFGSADEFAVNGTTRTLLGFLNNWVSQNNYSGDYKRWTSNDGEYPVFAAD